MRTPSAATQTPQPRLRSRSSPFGVVDGRCWRDASKADFQAREQLADRVAVEVTRPLASEADDENDAALDAGAAAGGDAMRAVEGAARAMGSASCRGADAFPATVYSPSPAQGGEVVDEWESCGKVLQGIAVGSSQRPREGTDEAAWSSAWPKSLPKAAGGGMAMGSAVVAARAANPYGSVLAGDGLMEAAVAVRDQGRRWKPPVEARSGGVTGGFAEAFPTGRPPLYDAFMPQGSGCLTDACRIFGEILKGTSPSEVGDAKDAERGDPRGSDGATCATDSAACRGADALPATVYSPFPAQGGEVADDGKCGKAASQEVLAHWSVDGMLLNDELERLREAGENPYQSAGLTAVAAAACNSLEIGDRRVRADVVLIVRATALLQGARALLRMPTATLQRAATQVHLQTTRRMKFERKAQVAIAATLSCFAEADEDTESLDKLLERVLAEAWCAPAR